MWMISESPIASLRARFVRYDYIYYDTSRCAVREPVDGSVVAEVMGR